MKYENGQFIIETSEFKIDSFVKEISVKALGIDCKFKLDSVIYNEIDLKYLLVYKQTKD